mgnify:FL=1
MWGAVAGRKAAAEAYQRHFHIVKQTWPRGRSGVLTGNEDVVGASNSQKRQKDAGSFAQTAASPVADNGAAYLLGRGKAFASSVTRRDAIPALDDQKPAALGITPCNIKKFTPYTQALKRQRGGIAIGRKRAQSARRRYALRRLRPLARREARIFWPFFVAMRERNPWRRLRFRLLG